jgi:hypothetical protein
LRHPLSSGVLALAVALSGCNGGGGAVMDDELPVACVARAEPGPCGGSVPKAYYDYRENRCKTFYWSGCGGHVPYQTLADCVRECVDGGEVR